MIRILSLVAALLLSCASTGAQAYARPLHSENARQGFAATEHDAHREQAHVTPEAASENSPPITEASDGRRFYAKARYYNAGRGGFLSTDPWGGDQNTPLSYNKYLYAYASPGSYIDPDGRAGWLTSTRNWFDDADAWMRGHAQRNPFIADQIGVARGATALVSAPFRTANFASDSIAQSLPGEAFQGVSSDSASEIARFVDPAANYLGEYVRDPVGTTLRTNLQVALSLGQTVAAAADGDGAARSDIVSGLTQFAVPAGTASALRTVVTRTATAEGRAAATMVEGSGGGPAARFLDPAMIDELEDAYRAAGRAEEPAQVRVNQFEGARREGDTLTDLQAKYPDARIQQQVYLRTADGKRAKDPLTGEARRVDFVVIEDTPDGPRVVDIVETTSPTAAKDLQNRKEQRIRQAEDVYVRDRQEKCLLSACDVETRFDRRE